MTTCKKHPRYKGLRPPRVACEACWVLYLGMSETCHNCGCQCIEGDEAPEVANLHPCQTDEPVEGDW